LKDKNIQMLNQLFEISKNIAPIDGARIAAGVVFKNNFVSIGFCQRKTDPMQKQFAINEHCIYMHAEIHAIKQAKKILTPSQFKKSSIFVARSRIITNQINNKKIKKSWKFGLAKPCEGCQSCIEHYGLQKSVYTTNTGYSVDFH
tara:strand:- start:66756 stop:67190 length:435 start_codon:yes stop_codon:yes gene_type:complete